MSGFAQYGNRFAGIVKTDGLRGFRTQFGSYDKDNQRIRLYPAIHVGKTFKGTPFRDG